MGQYYSPTLVNASGKMVGWLNSHDYEDEGLKLMEHSCMGKLLVNAVCSQIADNPMRIAWIGDYSEEPWDGTEPYQKKISQEEFDSFYKKAWGESQKKYQIHPEPLEGLDRPEDFTGRYLVNHTRKSFVDLGEFQQENGWQEERNGEKYWCSIHPLPLLTACGNGRGSGDYHEGYPDWDKCGLWAFDLIEFSTSVPDGYEKETYHFKETN